MSRGDGHGERFLVAGDPITPEVVEYIVDRAQIPYTGRANAEAGS